MRNMGGLAKPLKWTNGCFLVGCIAIAGIPPFSAFFSKDEIIGGAWNYTGPGGQLVAWILILTAALTAFYMFRMYFMTFANEYRGKVDPHAETKVTPLTAPLLVLAVPSFAAGWLGISPALFGNANALESPFGYFVHWGPAEAPNFVAMGISVV